MIVKSFEKERGTELENPTGELGPSVPREEHLKEEQLSSDFEHDNDAL